MYWMKVVVECRVVMGTEHRAQKSRRGGQRGSLFSYACFMLETGATRWDRGKRTPGQEKISITDGTGMGCCLPLGMKWWDVMSMINGPPWQSRGRKARDYNHKAARSCSLGEYAWFWLSKNPFWSSCCLLVYFSARRAKPHEEVWRKKNNNKTHNNCHDWPIAEGCSKSNRWNGKVKAGFLQPVVYSQAEITAPHSCTRKFAKNKVTCALVLFSALWKKK